MTNIFHIRTLENCLIRHNDMADAPALIMLAGYADNGTMFLPLFNTALVSRFNLIAIDLPGSGSSPASADVRSVDDHAELLARLIPQITSEKVGLIGHSIASAICVETTRKTNIEGLFSIEGNLTDADAYFTGRAAKYDSADEFWTAQRMTYKAIGIDNPILQRYYAAASFADSETMWHLGRDATAKSKNNGLGKAFLSTECKTHYFWSPNNTPDETQKYIRENNIENTTYSGSHWPTIDSTEELAGAIDKFFCQCF
ncbi:MAG: alpha/beta fold hydrolase [Methyloligellaceae bacterium]